MSYNLYPITNSPYVCNDYIVKINGSTVKTDTARVSAFPFNRRWPGHQRQIDQTEIIQFLSLETDEPLSFEITPSFEFENVKIRPKSLGITPVIENGTIKFTLDKPAYFTIEPCGRNHALHIFADPIAQYDIDKNDPNVIYFGKGEHDVGLIELKSNQTIFIDEGAVVYACIHAIDAENIKILGRGILDNSKNKEVILFEYTAEGNDTAVENAYRRHTLELEYCTNIEIDGITMRDSLVYNVRPVGCKNINIKNVKIIGCWRFNSDGIDMHNCIGVRIADCFIRTFDDAICVKGFDCYYEGDVAAEVRKAMYRNGKAYDIFEDVIVEGCVIWNDWGKSLEIGAETKAEEIRNITFRNCDIIHVVAPALDCMNVDYADVHDVVYKDINIECDENIPTPKIQVSDAHVYEDTPSGYMPEIIYLDIVFHHEYSRGCEDRRGKNRNFLFENIYVWGDILPTVSFRGYDDEHMSENVLISGLYLNGERITELPDKNFKIRNFSRNIELK